MQIVARVHLHFGSFAWEVKKDVDAALLHLRSAIECDAANIGMLWQHCSTLPHTATMLHTAATLQQHCSNTAAAL